MTQPSPTPVPDHGTGWGLLLLFVGLYGTVALLGGGTVVAVVLTWLDRRVPAALRYLVVAVLVAALGLSGFTVLVAATARMYDVVVLLALVVFLPLTLVVLRRRGTARDRLALLTDAAMAWSVPFLVGFGVIAGVGTQGDGLPPEITGALAAVIVTAGTIVVERLPLLPAAE